jgi:diadenylate cyclase
MGAMHGWLHNWGWANLGHAVRTGADILVVWYLTYRLIMLAKGTRAWQIITGLLVFVCILAFSSWAQLTALNWILQKLFYLGPVAIVILFFPELRHALEEVGRLGFWGKNFSGLNKEDISEMIGEITRAADAMAEKKVGALMVLERETGLTDIIETGTVINSVVNAELLQTIFYPGTMLHDGAVVIRRDRIVAAGCTLPLSENPNIGTTVHTRHKAGLGITEQSDALAVIVSEERGTISLAFRGRMVALRGDDLRSRLIQEFTGRETPSRRRRGWRPGGRPPKPPPPTGASPLASAPPVTLPEEEIVTARETVPPSEARR